MRKRNVTLSDLQCPDCKHTIRIPRPKGRRREKNHIKHMWCYKCKAVTGHVEKYDEYEFMY